MPFNWRFSRATLYTAFGFSVGAWLGKNYDTIMEEYKWILPLPQLRAASLAQDNLIIRPSLDNSLTPPAKQPGVTTAPPSTPSRVSEIMRFGYPGFDTLRTFEDFVLSYDRRNRVANWVVEHLAPERMVYDPSVDRKKCDFQPDSSIHPFFRATNDDYKKSGYDRGHMAAAANHRKSQNAITQTFLLSNMAPQVGENFNRGKWSDLEKHARTLARKNRNVYVCTGPLYLPQQAVDGKLYVKYEVIGKNNVAVPTHFFKVILVDTFEGHLNIESYIMPNARISDETPLKAFQVPLESIERAAGFLVFENLPKSQLKLVNGKRI